MSVIHGVDVHTHFDWTKASVFTDDKLDKSILRHVMQPRMSMTHYPSEQWMTPPGIPVHPTTEITLHAI